MIVQSNLGSRNIKTRLKPVSGWPPLMALIDLLFLLLLLFVLSTQFVRVSGFKVELPRVSGGNEVDMKRHIVTVMPGEKDVLIYFNDKPVSLEQLKQDFNTVRNHSGNGEDAIILIADKSVSYEAIAEIMSAAESAQLATFLPVAVPTEKHQSVFLQ